MVLVRIVSAYRCDSCGHFHFWINMGPDEVAGEGKLCQACLMGVQVETLLYGCSCGFESEDRVAVVGCERQH